MSCDATNGDVLDDEARSGPHRLGTVAVTIGCRVVGAFALVLVLLLALGVSGFVAIRSIALEAKLVETGARAGVTHTEFNVQLRSTLSRAKLYATSEDAKDLDSLRVAVAELKSADAKLDVRQPLPGSVSAASLRDQTGRYLRSLDAIVALIDARRTHSLEMRQAAQVPGARFAGRAAPRHRSDPDALGLDPAERNWSLGDLGAALSKVPRPHRHGNRATLGKRGARRAQPADGCRPSRRRPFG